MAFLSDLAHYWGNDLSAAASGDLLSVQTTMRGQQRVLRRLLTNPGDDMFNPTYGAGLAKYVGSTASPGAVAALIRGQMLQEQAVAPSPPPVIAVQPITAGLSVQINYNDAPTGQPVVLSFNVSA